MSKTGPTTTTTTAAAAAPAPESSAFRSIISFLSGALSGDAAAPEPAVSSPAVSRSVASPSSRNARRVSYAPPLRRERLASDRLSTTSGLERSTSPPIPISKSEFSAVPPVLQSPRLRSSSTALGQRSGDSPTQYREQLLRRIANDPSAIFLDRRYWVPDDQAASCYDCGDVFTTFLRRHHCRVCGQVFCAQCSRSAIQGSTFNAEGQFRACNHCLNIISEPEFVKSIRLLRLKTMPASPSPGADQLATAQVAPGSPGLARARPSAVLASTSGALTASASASSLLSPVATLATPTSKRTASPVVTAPSDDAGSPTQAHDEHWDDSRVAARPVQSRTSMDYSRSLATPQYLSRTFQQVPLLSRKIIADQAEPRPEKERRGSTVDVPLLLPEDDDLSSDEDTDMRFDESSLPDQQRQDAAGVVVSKLTSAIAKTPAPVVERAATTTSAAVATTATAATTAAIKPSGTASMAYSVPAHSNYLLLDGHRSGGRKPAEATQWVRGRQPGVVRALPPRIDSISYLNSSSGRRNRLRKLLQSHFDKMLLRVVAQLVPAEGLDCAWVGTIVHLALRAAAQTRPALELGDSLDIRDHIKVKLIPGGRASDCFYIDGIVFKKNVAHRRMRDNFDDPRILLLGCSIEYQRIASTLSTFDTLLASERAYLMHVVERICAIKPTVILVEGTVSRLAQEMFLGSGITLVVNVKRSVLRRVARVTDADIVPSTEHGALEQPKLGRCGNFRVRHFLDPGTAVPQPVVLISGCDSAFGGTCILRGGGQALLEPVKKILTFAVLAAYHLRLEAKLLQDFNVAPTTLQAKSPMLLPSLDGSVVNQNSSAASNNSNTNNTNNKSSNELAARFYNTLSKYYASIDDADALPPELLRQAVCLSYSPDVDFSSCAGANPALPRSRLAVCIPSNYVRPSFDCPTAWPRATVNPDNQIVEHDRVIYPVDFARLFQVKDDSGRDERSHVDLALRLHLANNESVPLLRLPRHCKEMTAIYQCQQLAYTYAMYCRGEHHPKANCIPFDLHLIDFYSDTDVSVGEFFRRHLFEEEGRCLDKDCARRLIEHDRSFLHNATRIDFSVHSFTGERPPKFERDDILTSTQCQVCSAQEPFQPLRGDSLRCSFGKFLELLFYNNTLQPFSSARTGCKHQLQLHTRYFVYRDWIAQMTFKPIALYAIHEPSLHVAPPMDKRRQLVLAQIDDLKATCQEIAALMQARINAIAAADSSDQAFVDARDKLAAEHRRICQFMLESLERVDAAELARNPCLLNASRRQIYVTTVAWCGSLLELQHIAQRVAKPPLRSDQSSSSLRRPSSQRPEGSEPTTSDAHAAATSPLVIPVQHHHDSPLPATTRSFSLNLSAVGDQQHLDAPTDGSRSEPSSPCPPPASPRSLSSTPGSAFVVGAPTPVHITPPPTPATFTSPPPTPTPPLTDSTPAADGGGDTSAPNLTLVFSAESGKGAEAPADSAQREKAPVLKEKIPRMFAPLFDNFRVRPSAHLLQFMVDGVGLLLPEGVSSELQICPHSNELGSVLAYALNSTDYASKFQQKFGYAHSGAPQVQQALDKDSPECSVLFAVGLGTHQHIETRLAHEVHGVAVKIKVVSYFAEGFQSLRRLACGGDFQFLASLARSQTWHARGGKSNSSWERTQDGRFVIKQISRAEIESFLEFGPRYFHYMGDVFSDGIPTVLAKCLGVFSIAYSIGRRSVGLITVLVMENLFCGRQISKVYDLKGSLRSRYVKQSTEPSKLHSEVWLDENLLEWMFDDPIPVDANSKAKLMTSIYNDTLFLAHQDVMDYSLLVGIDEQSRELVVGIIDYFRTFTLDKVLEMWIKKTGVLGKGKVPPTVISPGQYMTRFREQLWLYFVLVPHKFTSIDLLPADYDLPVHL